MKKYMKAICMIGFTALTGHVTLAHKWVGGSNLPEADKPATANSGTNKSAACTPAVRRYTLEFNDVEALLEMGGVLFSNRQSSVSAYEVPRVAGGVGPRAIFAAALWMGGTDVNGQLKLAAVRFRQEGNDFW